MKIKIILFLLLSFSGICQNNFEGRVINEEGLKIIGANILIPKTKEIKNSDKRGVFFIETNNKIIKIIISHVGYITKEFEVDITKNNKKDFIIEEGILLKDEIKVLSTRAKDKSPFAFSNISKNDIERNNIGKDIPFLLEMTPSVYTTSDAGNGIGYTGVRIRGSDPTRINVTINGIPYNDSESHGVFWVNLPDLASSSNSIQVQRGVGSSTNGGGAFGGTISIKTGKPSEKFSLNYSSSLGSYKTFKNTININSGLIKNKLNLNLRLSKINSDGYVDRASSDLRSYYLSASYYLKKSVIDFINFSGKEKTYQSWYGTPQARVINDIIGIEAVISNNGFDEEQKNNLLNSGRTYNYYTYKNETDNYQQDHYQIHFNHEFSKSTTLNFAFHHTYGRGYYEQYRKNDNLTNYFDNLNNLFDGDIPNSNIIKRRWLDNNFSGLTFSFNNKKKKTDLNIGGAYNIYDGDHFGKIVSTGISTIDNLDSNYYFSSSNKKDGNMFLKYDFLLNEKTTLFSDIQFRYYSHQSNGSDNDISFINIKSKNLFFNPKLGINKIINEKINIYSSIAIANREPIRSDFLDSYIDPKHETLFDFEIGKNLNYKNGNLNLNFYWMEYINQLITTGEINDVGGNIRTNVKKSRRVGIEISNLISNKNFKINSSITISENRVYNFKEVIYDYGDGFDEFNIIENNYIKTDISFSPKIIANNNLEWKINKYLSLILKSRYIGNQFLDNTSNTKRIIKAYLINDLKLEYKLSSKPFQNLFLKFSINNIFNEMYSSNGYTFGYFGGATFEVRENYLYPQAGRNYMFSIKFKI